MAQITPPAQTFATLSDMLLSKITDCEKLKGNELVHLSPIINQLQADNAALKANLGTDTPTLTSDVLKIMTEVPIKCFVTPAPGPFDEVMPELADFEITYEDEFGNDQKFNRVMQGFAFFCKTEEVLLRTFEAVKKLAIDNQALRTQTLLLASGDELAELEKANGMLPLLDTFSTYLHTISAYKAVYLLCSTVRRVPYKVSSDCIVPDNDPMNAYELFSHYHKYTDLVLEELIPVAGVDNAFHYPFTEYYIPPLWTDGVTSSAICWKKTQPQRMYKWEGMVEILEPGEGGGKRWFPTLPAGGRWEY